MTKELTPREDRVYGIIAAVLLVFSVVGMTITIVEFVRWVA